MDEESYHVDESDSQKDFRHFQNECRKKKEFIDVQLQLGAELFDAHRVVLSFYSPMLKAMFSDQWSAKKICPLSEEFVDPEIMKDLLNFFYTGKITLTPDNVHPVCMAAHYMQISSLLEHSVGYLCKLITAENVLTLTEFSTRCELEELREECGRFIRENSFEILQDSHILELSFNNFHDLILELREGYFYGTILREHTFDCIVRWTGKKLQERSGDLSTFLKNIPLEELSFDFLTQAVSNHPLVKNSISCQETVSSALENYQPSQNLIVIGGGHRQGVNRDMKCYDWYTAKWRELPEMLSPRTQFGAAVVNGRDIIVCGGFKADYNDSYNYNPHTTAEVEMFVWANQTWVKLQAMQHPRAGILMAICNDQLYVAGGKSKGNRNEYYSLANVMRYSFETQEWKFVKSMNVQRAFGQLIEHKNYLYAIGGGTNTVERYDPTPDEWTMMASMKASFKNSQSSFGATLHEDKIYVCGKAGFEVYDPETNVWTSLPEFFDSYCSSLVSINGKLLVFGGHKSGQRSNEMVYEYNFETKKWIEFCDKFPPLANHFSVVGAFH